MIVNRKEFYGGAGMMALFLIILALFFAPLYGGHNGLAYLDNLYNSISKNSVNYIDMVQDTAKNVSGTEVDVVLKGNDAAQIEVMTRLLESTGARLVPEDAGLRVTGDLGAILQTAVTDVEDMYHNRGAAVSERRGGLEAREGLYTWWHLLGQLEKQLKKQSLFASAKDVALVITRGVEPAYNYYGVEAQRMSERLGVVIFSLVFYVVYTLWYGFAILFMFEGWGLKIGH
ncbi:MAG: hypothetical protein KKB70_06865 [Proteobacteria bacterium]|nr:hypothetical protein [Pseudomonadota bacterium]MBU1611617.1 hypothetical protein [Pseudomonadota bacterium]